MELTMGMATHFLTVDLIDEDGNSEDSFNMPLKGKRGQACSVENIELFRAR